MNNKIKSLLKQGDCCEIRIKDSDHVVRAELETVFESDQLLVHSKDVHATLDAHLDIEIALYQERIGVVKYEGYIQRLDSSENGVFLQIVVKEEIDATQRREFFRLSTIKNVAFVTKERHVYSGFTENISAGGAKCLTRDPIAEGDEVGFNVTFDTDEYRFKGKVLECLESDSKQYQIRLQFTGLSEKEQARLQAFILKEQGRQAAKFRN